MRELCERRDASNTSSSSSSLSHVDGVLVEVNNTSDDMNELISSDVLVGPLKLQHIKLNGWGYKDTMFEDDEGGCLRLTGRRYAASGKTFHNTSSFMRQVGFDKRYKTPPQSCINVSAIQYSNNVFISEIERLTNYSCWISFSAEERLFHGHGQTCQELFMLRHGRIQRLPDVVIYPSCHEDVQTIVELSKLHNVMIIPFGGGTSVTMGLLCPPKCDRMVASVDLSRMNRILWVKNENYTACIEAGATGKHIETQLGLKGFTLGHLPDSYEFSTLGGWIATRASGMKMNTYGNIEDLVLDITFVTPRGVHNQNWECSRMSSGPSINELIIGSEGILGIVTKAIVKIRAAPNTQRYGSIVFPRMEAGIAFMREIAKRKLQPTSVRLMDNFQFRFGMALKYNDGKSLTYDLVDGIKKFYLRYISGFKPEEMVACTLMFEGNVYSTAEHEKKVYKIGKKFMGIPGGSKNGESGYNLVFLIAYIRDYIMNYSWIFESFESTLPWDQIVECCSRVKVQIGNDCQKYLIQMKPIIMIRLTQIYDTAGVLYFYFGFNYESLSNPMEVYATIENNARHVIMDCGGTISHHHGVGKLRKQFLARQLGQTGITLLQGLKNHLDPTNVFGCENLV